MSDPAYEVDVMFGKLNSFLSIIRDVQVSPSKCVHDGVVLSVSDSIIERLQS